MVGLPCIVPQRAARHDRFWRRWDFRCLKPLSILLSTRPDTDASIAIALEFANGRILINARRQGDALMQEASSAYLRDGKGYVSVYFGEEKSTSFAASASVRQEGETPLSDFNLSLAPIAVAFDRRLVSDRIFWRLPVG